MLLFIQEHKLSLIVAFIYSIFSLTALWFNLTNSIGQYSYGKKNERYEMCKIREKSEFWFYIITGSIIAIIPGFNIGMAIGLGSDRLKEIRFGESIVKQWLSSQDDNFLAFVPVLALGLVWFLI